MTKEKLSKCVIDHAEALNRYRGSEERYRKDAIKFLYDYTFKDFLDALHQDDIPRALRAIHLLKQTTWNYSFGELFDICCRIHESLCYGGTPNPTLLPEAQMAHYRLCMKLLQMRNQIQEEEFRSLQQQETAKRSARKGFFDQLFVKKS